MVMDASGERKLEDGRLMGAKVMSLTLSFKTILMSFVIFLHGYL
jgi:hypothetical protein